VHGLSVIRGAVVQAPAKDFEWDFAAGTATVRAPAPFSGSATFTRGPDGRKRLTGSLRVPILGGSPIRLAGPAFNPTLHRGTPSDD
jgi:hypothetical protein